MKQKERPESKDGLCPYCGSDYVLKTCAFGDFISKEKMDNERMVVFKCYTCNKEFFCRVGEQASTKT